MEKRKVSNFDLSMAFKALDEIEPPKVSGGIMPQREGRIGRISPAPLTESLIEDYYDVSSPSDLADAKALRDAEVAKAKLARIEKIVDLDADSEDELQPSYVGKIIIQCPQCMTLFYKDKNDIVPSDEDPNTVNVGEVCQHCGNDSGYMLIGKTEAVQPEELEGGIDSGDGQEFPQDEEPRDEEQGAEEGAEEPKEEEPASEEPQEEEPKDEEPKEEEAPEEEGQDYELPEVPLDDEEPNEEKAEEDGESDEDRKKRESLTEAPLTEDALSDMPMPELADEVVGENGLMDEKEFKTPVTPSEIDRYFAQDKAKGPAPDPDEIEVDEFDEESFDEALEPWLRDTYENVDHYKTVGCEERGDRFIVEGVYSKGDELPHSISIELKPTLCQNGKIKMEGYCKKLSKTGDGKMFEADCRADGKKLITEGMAFSYAVGSSLLEGYRASKRRG